MAFPSQPRIGIPCSRTTPALARKSGSSPLPHHALWQFGPEHALVVFGDQHPLGLVALVEEGQAEGEADILEDRDEAEELDDGIPMELADDYRGLMDALPNLCVLGGCCGTDHRHVAAIAVACVP